VNLTGRVGKSTKPWTNLYDRIKPISKLTKVKNSSPQSKKSKQSLGDKDFRKLPQSDFSEKVSVGINKNSILSEYQESCIKKGIYNKVSTIMKGENPSVPHSYPLHYCLISECRMKSSQNLQHWVKDLHFNKIVVFLIKNGENYLSDEDINNLKNISKMHQEMVNNVL
jgi:hypothetical protein